MQAYSAYNKNLNTFTIHFKIPVIIKTGILIFFSSLFTIIIPTHIYSENNKTFTSFYNSEKEVILVHKNHMETEPMQDEPNNEEPDEWTPKPAKAAMLSATLPGLGQIYNRKYWKAPIIYAGFGVVLYFLDMNSTNYQKYRTAYFYRIDGNPHTVDEFPNYSTDVLRRAMNYYRRNLEITYIVGGALYILNVLDASVDAHLMDFDIGEDLSLRMDPVIERGNFSTSPNAGLKLTIRF